MVQAYFVELKQNTTTCELKAISQQPTNWSAWGGLWTPCAGSVTPWQTHFGSEEYEPSAFGFAMAKSLPELWNLTDKSSIQSQMRYVSYCITYSFIHLLILHSSLQKLGRDRPAVEIKSD